jgi:sterol desaturase/sphingolipid hydroxylase (fatty acid hydroxylase superfamily)
MANILSTLIGRIGSTLGHLLLAPGSLFSLWSLLAALLISAVFLLARKRMRPRLLLRALLPQKLWRSRSGRLDIGLFLMNSFVTGALIGWAILSYGWISHTSFEAARLAFGHSALPVLPSWARAALLTLVLFLAYDFGYWLDHYTAHKIPLRWEFHRVHHTAEVLSPFTAYRVHPVDTLLFANIIAIVTGVADGLTRFGLGAPARELAVDGTNIALLAFVFTTVHLQHSHIDIRFTGWLGRVLFSPAHHHIHHSSKASHYDANLGSCLAVWDHVFGTLILPTKAERPGKYGAEAANGGMPEDPHSIYGSLIAPFRRAARYALPRRRIRTRALQPGE